MNKADVSKMLPPLMTEASHDEFIINLGHVMNGIEEGGLGDALRKRDFPNMLLAAGVLINMRMTTPGTEIDVAKVRAALKNSEEFAAQCLNLATWIGAIMQAWVPTHFDELKR